MNIKIKAFLITAAMFLGVALGALVFLYNLQQAVDMFLGITVIGGFYLIYIVNLDFLEALADLEEQNK
jgi:hypothetical protein